MPANLFSDPPLIPMGDSGLMLAPGANVPGVGMANAPGVGIASPAAPTPTAPASNPSFREKLSALPWWGKALIALGEGANQYSGRPSALQAAVKSDQQERLIQTAQLKEHLSALDDYSRIASRLTGDAKTKFVEDGRGELNKLRPGLAGGRITPTVRKGGPPVSLSANLLIRSLAWGLPTKTTWAAISPLQPR